MESWIRWIAVPALITAAPVYAVRYLTVEQAQALLFPAGTRFTPHPLELSPEQKRAIEQASGVRARDLRPKAWRVLDGERTAGWLFVDQVIGKHEFITYALALTPDGTVRGIEVMDYRETYGYEIRNAEWRRQFVGKHNSDALKLGDDIQNVTGATLSCRHVTQGVKRLLATYEAALK